MDRRSDREGSVGLFSMKGALSSPADESTAVTPIGDDPPLETLPQDRCLT